MATGKVVSVEWALVRRIRVCNLEVENAHSFVAGSRAHVAVKNCRCSISPVL